MLHRFIYVLVLLMYANATLADDDCVRATPQAAVKDTGNVSNYSISGLNTRFLTESFNLSSGQNVEIIQSGCAHFGLTYRFFVEPFSEDETITTAISLVEQVLNVAPLMASDIYGALLSVEDRSLVPESITLIEGYDWVYVSIELIDGNTVLVVAYDIAL